LPYCLRLSVTVSLARRQTPVKWLKRLFGKFKSKKTEEAPAAAPPAVTITAENEKTEKSEPAAEVADELAKTEPVAEPVAEADAEPVAETPKPKSAKATSSKSTTAAESKAEPPKAKAESPKTESPKSESPKAKAPAKSPKAESPKTESPKTEPTKSTSSKDEAAEGPFGPGSAAPLADGAAPSEEFTVKGKKSSKLFHTAESPYFGRTKADVWFRTPADAESAGFAAWNHKKKSAASK
jgi:hypothetical protein